MHITSLPNIKYFGHKIRIKFNSNPLVIEQNNYTTKIGNAYVVYDLDNWLKVPPNNFKFKNCLFGATNIVTNNNKEKWVYSGHGIKFDSAGSWSFGNDDARNVVMFGVGNSSSSHAGNGKNKFLVLGKGPIFSINGSFGSPERKFGINFSKAKTKFGLSLHCKGDNSYLFVNGKEIFKLNGDNKNVKFLTRFV